MPVTAGSNVDTGTGIFCLFVLFFKLEDDYPTRMVHEINRAGDDRVLHQTVTELDILL